MRLSVLAAALANVTKACAGGARRLDAVSPPWGGAV
jgi:hypothetical protein